MKIYALYYYDRPILRAFLDHYCQMGSIDEIIIQDQNWSNDDTLYLLNLVAGFIDVYKKKIVVLPSTYKRVEGDTKFRQFEEYGEPTIRNRVAQFLSGSTWIMGAMDEIIYGQDYADTDRKLREFEQLAEYRAKANKNTIGFLPFYCVYYDGFIPCYGMPTLRGTSPTWRHRIFRFIQPFSHQGAKIHDNSIDLYVGNMWKRVTPIGDCRNEEVGKYKTDPLGVYVNLQLLHYHTLIRPKLDSPDYVHVEREQIKNLSQHPAYYVKNLP